MTDHTNALGFVQIHLLWGAAAALTNAGENGEQKTIRYAGVDRARVSSQAFKRPTRIAFNATLNEHQRAWRTRDWRVWTAQTLTDEHGWDETEAEEAASRLGKAIGTSGKTDSDGDGLLLLRSDIVAHAVALAIEHRDLLTTKKPDKTALKKAAVTLLDEVGNVDIAFNGRMVAANQSRSVDAAVHVADALGVSFYQRTLDYFTAVEDLPAPGNEGRGGGMIGERERGSALYYRHATIDLAQAAANLPGTSADQLAAHAVDWTRAFTEALPAANRTTTAATARPTAILIEHAPTPYGNLYNDAFALPVGRDSNDDRDENIAAANRLTTVWEQQTWWHPHGPTVAMLPPRANRPEAITYPASWDAMLEQLHTTLTGGRQ